MSVADINNISIKLSEDDARLFIRFQKYHALIQLLESKGAFDIKGGSITLHFGGGGQIKAIDKHQYYQV
jgi:hypothetical protein